MRRCSVCKVEKEYGEFHRKKEGYSYMCKECRKSYIREHYKKDKQYYVKKAKVNREKVQDWFREYKKTLKCEFCGDTRWWVLDFHHRDPSIKDGNISTIVAMGSKDKLVGEIAKCSILCSNCHRDLHYKQGFVAQGIEREPSKF